MRIPPLMSLFNLGNHRHLGRGLVLLAASRPERPWLSTINVPDFFCLSFGSSGSTSCFFILLLMLCSLFFFISVNVHDNAHMLNKFDISPLSIHK